MPFSTGVITNTKAVGTAASNIVVSTRNADASNTSQIVVQIFASVASTVFYPAYVSNFVVAAKSFDVREFFIAGNVAYEVQINVISVSPSNVMVTVTGIDGSGNLVTNQQVLQSELTTITALTPIP
ncbi:hypothetical protein O9H85_14305 [Paenibacillus filicis]|uniref:Exosporium protein C n=1 Tax=Paenibacillus gyeongsangnamensis TaxID=3388067 RepID=A0ABT4Q9N0_9BACL|nr:hypothetical protein [Paenibacillus filicis]MCZ8513585.1 hypothetical protein [Paenibacillus filicis]